MQFRTHNQVIGSPTPYPLRHQFSSDNFRPITIYNHPSVGNTRPIASERKEILLAVDSY